MKNSQIAPVLGHLIWLLRPSHRVTELEQARQKALLVYNAAAILQWRASYPASKGDELIDANKRAQATSAIDAIVTAARKAASDLVTSRRQDFGPVLSEASKAIRPLLGKLAGIFGLPEPKPVRVEALERAQDIPGLINEAVATYKDAGVEPAPVAKTGPDAGITEALAQMTWYAGAGGVGWSPEDRRSLVRMAAGYLKTAMEMKAEVEPSPELEKAGRVVDAALTDLESAA